MLSHFLHLPEIICLPDLLLPFEANSSFGLIDWQIVHFLVTGSIVLNTHQTTKAHP
jgi:hypothetical protein